MTVIDAVAGEANLDARPEAVRQVAVADRIVLTKTDLADADVIAATASNRLNPGAPVIDRAAWRIDPAAILNAGLFNPATENPRCRRLAARRGARASSSITTNTMRASTSFCLTFDQPLHWQGVGHVAGNADPRPAARICCGSKAS